MNSIVIPDTDIQLSGIGLGTAGVGLKESCSGENADRLLEGYIDGGGNLIDTAHVYSDWIPGEESRSERVVGDWIRRRKKRVDFVLMTKGGHPRIGSMNVSRLSPKDMTDDLDGSLKKLGTDYIDIYLYHRDDVNRPVEELVEQMEDFRRSGKIRYYGCSNWTVPRMKEAARYCEKMGYRGFVVNQAMYNIGVKHMKGISDKTMVVCDGEMLKFHESAKTLLMPYSGNCGGFFHVLKERGAAAVKNSNYCSDGNLEIGRKVSELCERRGYSVTQVLMGFFATRKVKMLPLAAVDSTRHLKDITDALHTDFCESDYDFCGL